MNIFKKIKKFINIQKNNKKILHTNGLFRDLTSFKELTDYEIHVFKKIIFECNLKIKNEIGNTPIMHVFTYNKEKKLNFNQEELNFLIENSDLNKKNKDGSNALYKAIKNNDAEKLQLTSQQLKYIYDKSNKEIQEETFILFIKDFNDEISVLNNGMNILNKINFLLYDCNFQPTDNLISWLKRKGRFEVLQTIENRNIQSSLEQNLQKNSIKKANKI